MKFFRSKLVYIFIFIMTVACVTSLVIAVRTTATIIDKKEQAVKPVAVQNKERTNIKYLNAENVTGLPLYFNGTKMEKIEAFLADKKYVLYPIDDLLKKLGFKYSYYDSDDIFQSTINGKKILLNLGKDKFTLENNQITLAAAPLASNNHILVPEELIKSLEGFGATSFVEQKSAFINYFPDYSDKINKRINLLRFVNDSSINIADIEAKKPIFNKEDILKKEVKLQASGNGTVYLLKSDDKVYLFNNEKGLFTLNINIHPDATLSEDGKYAYWIDKIKKTSYIYEIGTGKTKEFGDYYFKIKNNKEDGNTSFDGTVISDYKVGTNYKRITFTDSFHSKKYIFIEKNGKSLMEGDADFSPDGKKLLCYKNGKCYLLSIDGQDITLLGDIQEKEYSWITNSKIFIKDHDIKKVFIISKKAKPALVVKEEWKKVGTAANGDLFYTKGDVLFAESEGMEKKIMDLPWTCRLVFGLSAYSPIIAVSDLETDAVFFINGGKINTIGKISLLLKGTLEQKAIEELSSGISIAPGGKSLVLFQNENGFLTLNNIIMKTGVQKKLVIDCPIKDQSITDHIKVKWINSDRLLLFSDRIGWIVDFKSEAKIYEWAEEKESIIKDVLLRP